METIRLRRDGFSVLAMGDFNSRVGQIPGLEQNHPGLNKNTPMFMNFIQQANLVIINTLPVARGLSRGSWVTPLTVVLSYIMD